MRYFALAIVSLLTSGCGMRHFTRQGYAPYCMVNYETKFIDCKYPTMNACRNDYTTTNGVRVCLPSRNIKFKGTSK